MRNQILTLALPAAFTLFTVASPLLAGGDDPVKFNTVVSAGAKAGLPNASAAIRITPYGPAEIMDVTVQALPPNTDFDYFVIQVPEAPFGVSWYQGDSSWAASSWESYVLAGGGRK